MITMCVLEQRNRGLEEKPCVFRQLSGCGRRPRRRRSGRSTCLAVGYKEEGLFRRYRILAKKFHPVSRLCMIRSVDGGPQDKNPGDAKAEDQFRRLAEAYEVLGDEQRRAEYDEERRGPRRPPPMEQHWHRHPGQVVRVYQNGYVFEVPLEDLAQFGGFGDFSSPPRRSSESDAGNGLHFVLFGLMLLFALMIMAQLIEWDVAQSAPPRTRSSEGKAPTLSAASSVRELKQEAQRRGLDISGCWEKEDLVSLLGCD